MLELYVGKLTRTVLRREGGSNSSNLADDLYSKKEIAIDLLKNFVNKDFTKDLKVEDLTLVNKSFISSDYEESESDIIYSAKIGETEAIFYILIEFQSRIDYRMPLRLLFYMVEILREFSKNQSHDKGDKDLKIPAVIPIVCKRKLDSHTFAE